MFIATRIAQLLLPAPVVTELLLPHASVASNGEEYFEVSFDERRDGTDGDTPCFLLQRQFESPDGGRVYIESHDGDLCGHVRVGVTQELNMGDEPGC